jgi:hypothetical protein
MAKQTAEVIPTTEEIVSDNTSSIQPRRSLGEKFKDLMPMRRLSRQQDGLTRSQKKDMELAQRRLQAVAFYDQNLQERINDTLAADEERSHAVSEKKVWDRKTQEEKEVWVTNRIMVKEGWGAGVYPEGACGPGMWYR